MEHQNLQRIHLLIDQNRFDLAEKELLAVLSRDPYNHEALCLNAYLAVKSNSQKALVKIEQLLSEYPDSSYGYYLMAMYELDKVGSKAAHQSIRKAISIDPNGAELWTLKALIEHEDDKFKEGLISVERALEIDPEYAKALNTRSLLLRRLGRKQEAMATAAEALRINPTDSMSHYNQGMRQLENSDHQKAMESFSESLRINPLDNELAREGLILAIKASNGFFRAFLRFQFWMANQSSKNQWYVIVGFYLLFRLFRYVAVSSPEYRVFLVPLLILMGLFAILTWIMSPVTDTFLLLHPFGRNLLNTRERISAILCSSFLLIAIPLVSIGLLNERDFLLYSGLILVAMSMTSGIMFNERSGNTLLYASIAMLTLGLIGIIFQYLRTSDGLTPFTAFFFLLFVGFQFFANYRIQKS